MAGTPKIPRLTRNRLVSLVDYNELTGSLTMKARSSAHDHRMIGIIIGSIDKDGYRVVCIDGEHIKAHRLIWFYVNGVWPNGEIDHKNLQHDDNRIDNLREATTEQNCSNTPAHRDNKTGLKGVSKIARNGKFRSVIHISGKQKYLGTFDTPEEAHAAYAVAAYRLHGEFARAA